MQKNLANITVNDLGGAKSKEIGGYKICPAGEHVFKILNFEETDRYNAIKVQEGTNKYSFFYNYYLKDSDVLDADLLNWMKSLATIPVDNSTTFQAITNSAIGYSYKVKTNTYVAKSGKNAGKEVAVIDFKTLPEPVVMTDVTTEDEELLFN